jgi:uncharacterized membrane protein
MNKLRDQGLAFVHRFAGATEGTYSILAAILAFVIIGFTGLAVDLGSIVYAQKRLQTATDAAALAATFDFTRSQSIAETALAANGPADAAVDQTYVGTYVDDPSLAAPDRFTLSAPGNAVQLTTRYDAPVHFMRMFTGSPTVAVAASAVAYTLPLAGLAIGTGIADADLGQLNAAIEAVTSNPYNLTAAERDALEATRISIFRLFDRLAAATGSTANTIETVQSASVDLPTLASAELAALSAQAPTPTPTETTAISALARIAGEASNAPSVPISEFLTLSAHQKRAAQDLISKATDSIGVPAMSILLGYMQMSRQNTLLNINETVGVPGLATIAVDAVLSKSVIGGGAPGIAMVGPTGSSANSSQGRIRLTITALNPIQINLGLINLSLTPTIPIVADLGYGSATISEISCGPDILATTDVAVDAQSGAVHLYIGNVNNSQLSDLTQPIVPVPAQIVGTPLVSVTAESQSDIAQSGLQTVHFSWDDITQGNVKTIDGSSGLATALTDLNSSLAITVSNAPLGTGALISSLLQTQVAAILSALQPELQSILASLGLRAGYMELRATAARCGIPALAM